MENRWSDAMAAEFIARYAQQWGRDLALRTYTSRLIGCEPDLVLHGGGNTSVKGTWTDVFGEEMEALFVKASGQDLANIEPQGHVALDLCHLRKLIRLDDLPDEVMVNELRTHQFDHRAPTPSIEALAHALIPGRYVDHSHADAILVLTNQTHGERRVREALGEEIIVLPYVLPGFRLAKAVVDACAAWPEARAMVWMHHGIVTWGDQARDSYTLMIELVSRAEAYVRQHTRYPLRCVSQTPLDKARERLARFAPVIRGMLATRTKNPDRPWHHVVLRPLLNREILDFLGSGRGRELAISPPLTTDHLIRTGVLPAWVDEPDYDSEERLRAQVDGVLRQYASDYRAYLDRNAGRMPAGIEPFPPLPRVVLLPGMGALCAGADAKAANIVHDITAQTLRAKASIAAMGAAYEGLGEEHLFDMEYRTLQHAKLERAPASALAGQVALVTGAAGAIGSAICQRLLEHGAHVAATDLPGPNLDSLGAELRAKFPQAVLALVMDVTDEGSIAAGFNAVNRFWGGLDILVVNAGVAHVSSLAEMSTQDFRRLERVNIDGTLFLLRQAATHFQRQRTGGDIVFVSTKNVFAPGARFGAYSATKAAGHQLARIASLELAEHDVRVNMVSPDAVFSHGERRSGLWAEVGPDRMRARGLDAAGLEEYYRSRNLLKARVTADHVANAVLFFLSRQTPTTGATLPVDGGLPDATPR